MKEHQSNSSGAHKWMRYTNLAMAAIFLAGLAFALPARVVRASSLLNTSFTSDSGGFTYADDTFSTSQPSYASGSRLTGSNCYGGSGGCLDVRLGGVDSKTITNMSGGWKSTFSLASATTGVSLSLRYRLVMPSAYAYDEYSRVEVSLDGTLFGRGSRTYIDHTGGDANFAHDTGWLQVNVWFGNLAAGSHTLILGGINNKKTSSSKITDIYFDDVSMTSGNTAPTPSAGSVLVGRLKLSNFTSDDQTLSNFGDRNRMDTSAKPWTSFFNAQAWVASQLTSMGYTVNYDSYTYSGWSGSNLYATKVGTVHPNQMYMISAHLDGRGSGGAADDNGSGCSLVLEVARALSGSDVHTDYSVRFIFFDQEEIGLYGSKNYVTDRKKLQGIENPAGSGLYPEPTWLGIIQTDMVLYDHGVGTRTTGQSPYADLDVEWKDGTTFATQSKSLAQNWRFFNGQYATKYPANSANNSTNTDDTSFMSSTASISVRENRRGLSSEWINPNYHTANDLFANYSADDFNLGFNAVQTMLGTLAELAGAHIY